MLLQLLPDSNKRGETAMRYHLKLKKALSYKGIVEATKDKPDVFVEDKAIADTAMASGYFTLLAADETIEGTNEETVSGHLDITQLDKMKVDDLKKLAMDMYIDTTGFKKKSEYVDAIASAEVEISKEEPLDEIIDYGEGSPTMVELQNQ